MDCDNTETLHRFLPQEIVEEIFSRLDVKTLLRLRCVSNTWRSLIDSDRFIKNQYRNSTKNTSLAHHRVIFDWEFSYMKQCSLKSMLDEPRLHPFPFDQIMTNYGSVVGCCNGLFCLVGGRRYSIWNPATKIFFELPPIDFPCIYTRKWGFGWDETTGVYKVFALSDYLRRRHRVARVYSSKTNSWKAVDHGSLSGQNLHWLTDCRKHIECFDLMGSESFGKIVLPSGTGERYHHYSQRLGEVRGCLSLLRQLKRGGADVWVMKEHNWQKLIRIPRRDYGSRRCLVGQLPSGDMLVISGNNFKSCGGVVKRKNITAR